MKYRKRTVYSTAFEAQTQALTMSYRTGDEYCACETYSGTWEVRRVPDEGISYLRPLYRGVVSTFKLGWSRGLHRQLGDESPVHIMHKCEVERTKYTW